MKIYRFFLAFLMILPLLQACQADITDLEDPRDAIAKKWRVTDNSGPAGAAGYDVTISKDLNETTRVLFENFHNLASPDKFYATLAGTVLTIPSQTLDGTYTINGEGIIANDLKSIAFEYTINDGDGPVNVVANFGEIIITKKKTVTVNLPVQ